MSETFSNFDITSFYFNISYLERIYPVSSIAINLYLPTASDYSIATWHGIVPTGK